MNFYDRHLDHLICKVFLCSSEPPAEALYLHASQFQQTLGLETGSSLQLVCPCMHLLSLTTLFMVQGQELGCHCSCKLFAHQVAKPMLSEHMHFLTEHHWIYCSTKYAIFLMGKLLKVDSHVLLRQGLYSTWMNSSHSQASMGWWQ